MDELKNQMHELHQEHRAKQREMRQLAHEERAKQREITRQLKQKARKERLKVRKKKRHKSGRHLHQYNEGNRELHTDVHFESNGYFDADIRQAFEKEMAKDGFIDQQQIYKFELTPEYFKINGEEQDAATLEKYLNIYKNLSGYELSGESKIKVRSKE